MVVSATCTGGAGKSGAPIAMTQGDGNLDNVFPIRYFDQGRRRMGVKFIATLAA
jgi:hypothetical protein